MNDVNKLKTVIGSLERQAEKVKEYSGLLSAVNEARVKIEQSKDALQSTANESKEFLNESQKSINSLNTRLASIEEKIAKMEQNQREHIDSVLSLFIEMKSHQEMTFSHASQQIGSKIDESKLAVLAASEENLNSLKHQTEAVAGKSSQQIGSKIDESKLAVLAASEENLNSLKHQTEAVVDKSSQKLSSKMTLILLVGSIALACSGMLYVKLVGV